MVKKYHIFTITDEDIDSAIRQAYKQLKDQSDSDLEFAENKKVFNQTRRSIREHPKQHYDNIMQQVMTQFDEIDYKFHGRFFDVVQNYMISNGTATDTKMKVKAPDAGVDL